jgi:hypothetical protein
MRRPVRSTSLPGRGWISRISIESCRIERACLPERSPSLARGGPSASPSTDDVSPSSSVERGQLALEQLALRARRLLPARGPDWRAPRPAGRARRELGVGGEARRGRWPPARARGWRRARRCRPGGEWIEASFGRSGGGRGAEDREVGVSATPRRRGEQPRRESRPPVPADRAWPRASRASSGRARAPHLPGARPPSEQERSPHWPPDGGRHRIVPRSPRAAAGHWASHEPPLARPARHTAEDI